MKRLYQVMKKQTEKALEGMQLEPPFNLSCCLPETLTI